MTPPKIFSGRLRKDVHRVMLDLLEQAAGPELNANTILRAGREEFGPRASADQPKAELHWLAERGCLNVELRGENILAAKLTRRDATRISSRPN